jgi:integrase/recombinase XerD
MVKVLRSVVVGPLEAHVVGFAEGLLRQGYTRSSAEQHICFIAHLDRWMQAEGVGVEGLSGSVIERYLVQRRAAGYVEYRSVKALQPLLSYFAPLGVLPVPQEVPPDAVEELLGRYRAWLLVERGVTSGTARGYVDCVRPFVATRVRSAGIEFTGLTAADVTGFVLSACPGRAVGSAKLVVCALRSLLRWLHLTGTVPVSLTAAVPSVAGWRLSDLPRGLEPRKLHRLLGGCDRRIPTGRRDYAILLLLARLGLRAGEVARLGLGDIDWRHGEVVILGKANRAERLPLPADVGAAIAAYLRAADRAPRWGAACSCACTPHTER